MFRTVLTSLSGAPGLLATPHVLAVFIVAQELALMALLARKVVWEKRKNWEAAIRR